MTTLQVGDLAPDFNSVDQDGNAISLQQFKGKKLVLYFYPKDNTPTCTVEACNIRDNYARFLAQGYAVAGVSPDTAASHKKFTTKFDLPFTLIADADKTIVNAYKVYGPKKFMGKDTIGVYRTTFVIDETGKIEKIITDVKSKEHADQIL